MTSNACYAYRAKSQPVADLTQCTGTSQFGPAYQVMLENDGHAPGSVDRVLMARMVRLSSETSAHLYGAFTATSLMYESGSRPQLEHHVESATASCSSEGERIAGIAHFCSGLGARAPQGLDAMRLGGTEEQIIARGSDWCTDVARVGCALFQVAGLAARIVYLADVHQTYSGHAITEVWRSGVWGAVDPTTGVIYKSTLGRPHSTWEVMNEPGLVDRHRQATSAAYSRPEQFARAAVSNYFVRDRAAYCYDVSSVNTYYRSILDMSDRGWPGGLRWLHGEETVHTGTHSKPAPAPSLHS